MVHYFLCVSHGEKGSVSFELAMHGGRFKLQAREEAAPGTWSASPSSSYL